MESIYGKLKNVDKRNQGIFKYIKGYSMYVDYKTQH